LGRILRKLFGIGKPRALQSEGGLAALAYLVIAAVASMFARRWRWDQTAGVPTARLAL
jgi:hypothetical protein